MTQPVRKCAGCQERRPQQGLVRFVVDSRGHLRADPRQRAPGRGVYTCPEDRCMAEAVKRAGFARGLRRRVAEISSAKLLEKAVGEIEQETRELKRQGLADGRIGRPVPAWKKGIVIHDRKLGERLAVLALYLEGLRAGATLARTAGDGS